MEMSILCQKFISLTQAPHRLSSQFRSGTEKQTCKTELWRSRHRALGVLAQELSCYRVIFKYPGVLSSPAASDKSQGNTLETETERVSLVGMLATDPPPHLLSSI